MKQSTIRMITAMFLVLFFSAACASTPTPDLDVPVTMGNVCDYDGQVVEVEGKLTLQQEISCTNEEPYTCELLLGDPFREMSMPVHVPVTTGTEPVPVNYMASLPESYEVNDFYIHTADDRLAMDGSFISVLGKVDTVYGGSSCSLREVESVRKLDRLVYEGIDFRRVTLQEAITEGLVVASITGDGLTRLDLRLKPEVELNLEVEIQAGTMFISATGGVQNMVARRSEMAYLKPNVEVSLELEVSCANMELKQPEGSDMFTVSPEAPNEDLEKLFALEEFPLLDQELQQFMVWTITDNPTSTGAYVGIDVDGATRLPWEDDIQIMRSLFEEAGIDMAQYAVFDY